MSAEDILAGLDPEQREVARAVNGPVVVLAGAGTGKTRAITHRIGYAIATGAHDARRTLAVTFTTRAAGEMRSRLNGLGVPDVAVRTFHSAALRQLTYFWPRVVGGSLPQLMASKAKLISEAAAAHRVRGDQALIRDLAAEIEWAKVSQQTPTTFDPVGRAMPGDLDTATVAAIYDTYEDIKSSRSMIDFEDVLLLTVGILDSRPDVLDEVHSVYRWFTIDEFQDVSPLQYRLMRLWLGERDDVCVVGDARQTIYTFAGANSDYLTNFAQDFPDATEIALVRCYRCTPQIVSLANSVFGSSSSATPALVSQCEPGPTPTIEAYDDEPAEAEAVALDIRSLIEQGVSPREICVLYRINAQSETYEEALADLGIATVMRGGERFFERAEVREAITRLRGAARAEMHDDIGHVVRDVLTTTGWTPKPPNGTGAVRERWESLSALATLADDLVEADAIATLSDLITELDRRATAQHAPQSDAVTLASLHAAKGLEWDAVFIVGCAEGTLPITYADTDARIEEERRLFYVGVTRARRHLKISFARARQPGGRANREPSRFLTGIASVAGFDAQASVKRGSGRARTERVRRGPATCRVCGRGLVTAPERTIGRCRTCPSSADEKLVDQLKVWRLTTAAEQSVPAYVVCTDATLMAIAEQLPRSDDELLAIPGIGPAKLERFGAEILALVAAHD